MIPVYFLEYELEEPPDKVFSRLEWGVEEIDNHWSNYLRDWNEPQDSSKPWIGIVDERKMKFTLEEPETFFRRKLNVVIKGKIELRASSIFIKVKLGIDNFTFFLITMMYAAIFVFGQQAYSDQGFVSYFYFSMFVIAYPTIGTLLIRRRIRRAERKLDQLFA